MNPFSLLILLQAATNMLYHMCDKIADGMAGGGEGEVDIIKVITDPLVDLVIQINSTVLEDWAADECDDCQLQKIYCPDLDSDTRCGYLFNYFGWDDWIVGAILVVVSLFILCSALILMVKTLNSLLQGAIAVAVKRILNPEWESPIIEYLWGYVNIAIGAVLTFCVQSSSVFTSTLTPLVGIGLIEVETVYPLFLGSNIGTTSTGMLAALATDSSGLKPALLVAFSHLFFNLFGILIFYPVPFMRVPIPMCKILGNTTAKYRWFALAYLVIMFLFVPVFFMGISINPWVFVAFIIPIAAIIIFLIVVTVMQNNWPEKLPAVLQTWHFLPKPLRSLEQYDR